MNFNNDRDEETQNEWQNDPDNWIWGIFYYNSKDNRLFAPKKIKQLGWTINFANPNSLFLVLLIVAILLIVGEHIK